MPFKSKAQRGYLYAKHPDVAAKFASETPKSSYKRMPLHVPKKPGGMSPKGTAESEERGESGPDPDDQKKKRRRGAADAFDSMC